MRSITAGGHVKRDHAHLRAAFRAQILRRSTRCASIVSASSTYSNRARYKLPEDLPRGPTVDQDGAHDQPSEAMIVRDPDA
jgi:hypothetical protein